MSNQIMNNIKMQIPPWFSDKVSHRVPEIKLIQVSTMIWAKNAFHSIEGDDEMGTSNGIGGNKPCRMYFLGSNPST